MNEEKYDIRVRLYTRRYFDCNYFENFWISLGKQGKYFMKKQFKL